MTDDGRPDGPDRLEEGDEDTDDRVRHLAELHADLTDDPAGGAARRARAEAADPEAALVLSALDEVRTDLAGLAAGAPRTAPPGLVAQLDRALAAERTTPGTARPATRRPRRALLVAAAVALAVVAGGVGVGVVSVVPAPGGAVPPPVAQPAPEGPAPPAGPPAVRPDDLPSALRTGLGGRPEALGGPLADPDRLAACLAAHGLSPTTRPAGVRRVRIEGAPGVLVVLPTGVAARFRVLVVGDGCAPGTPLTLVDGLVGR